MTVTEKFGAQRKILILEEKFGINCDLRWIIWNKLFFGRGPIWHREGYYMRNDQISDQMGRPATDRVGGVAGRPTPAQRLTGHAMQPTPRKPLQVKQLNNAKMFSHLPFYPTKIQRQRQK